MVLWGLCLLADSALVLSSAFATQIVSGYQMALWASLWEAETNSMLGWEANSMLGWENKC